jgi:hypothetical protein
VSDADYAVTSEATTDLPTSLVEHIAGSKPDSGPVSGQGISARTIASFLLFLDATILLIAGGHALMGQPVYTLEELFSLDNEPTIPGWYASAKLLLLAALLAVLSNSIGLASRQGKGLLAAAFIFLVMSCDEAAAVHERVQSMIANRFLADLTDNSIVLGKVVLGLAGLVVASAAAMLVIRTARRSIQGKAAFGLGFLLLASGAVGVDLLQEFFPTSGVGEVLEKILEEALEMTGVTFMIVGAVQAMASAPAIIYLGDRLYSRSASD